MNILLLLAHSIEEHDQLKLLSGLGYDVFSIGGYIDPAHPHDPKRPALPDVPFHPELKAVVDRLGLPDNLDAAKRHIPDELIDWADTMIVHHYEHIWIVGNWERIKHKRVIWRTVGQSVGGNEAMMAPYRAQGLQIVRYSPKERNIPNFAGEDALIRFYKDPDEWCGWVGRDPVVINITQHLRQRDPYTNWRFWAQATEGLNALPLGPGSEVIGGPGELTYDEMKRWLRTARAYLYTGTQPASYTLGLIEAMMTGIPVVSIGPKWMKVFPYGPDLFEGHEIVASSPDQVRWDGRWAGNWRDLPNGEDSQETAHRLLDHYLKHPDSAKATGDANRQRAIELFGLHTIGRQWAAFLG